MDAVVYEQYANTTARFLVLLLVKERGPQSFPTRIDRYLVLVYEREASQEGRVEWKRYGLGILTEMTGSR